MTKSSEFVRAQPAALRFALLETGAATEDSGKIRFSMAVTEIRDKTGELLDIHTAHNLDDLRRIALDDGTYTMVARWNESCVRWDLQFNADDHHLYNPSGIFAIVHWADKSLPEDVQCDGDAIAKVYTRMCPRKVA